MIPAMDEDGVESRHSSDAAEAGSERVEETQEWPGASRRWYLLLVLFFPILWVVVGLAFATYVGPVLTRGYEMMFAWIGLFVLLWVLIHVSVSRLVNLGMNKYWFLLGFVPVANLWLWYRSCACPAGYAKSRKLDAAGWILAFVYWLFVLCWVAIAILVPPVVSKWMKNPEFMSKIESIREEMGAVSVQQDRQESSGGEAEPGTPSPER
jgi:hypothetical protein